MTDPRVDAFRSRAQRGEAMDGLDGYLLAMWHDARGDWDAAHDCLQGHGPEDVESARIHAYLHRKEGDLPNARYWYRLAGVAMPSSSLDVEWEEIVAQLLLARSDDS